MKKSKILKRYNICIYCGSKKLKKQKKQIHAKNFYVDAIRSDLKLSENFIKQIVSYQCGNCHILQNNPWFKKEISRL